MVNVLVAFIAANVLAMVCAALWIVLVFRPRRRRELEACRTLERAMAKDLERAERDCPPTFVEAERDVLAAIAAQEREIDLASDRLTYWRGQLHYVRTTAREIDGIRMVSGDLCECLYVDRPHIPGAGACPETPPAAIAPRSAHDDS